MLAKEVLRNSMDLNRRIKEQCVIYQDWKAMAMEIDEDEIHEIVEAAWDDLIASIRLKRELEELLSWQITMPISVRSFVCGIFTLQHGMPLQMN